MIKRFYYRDQVYTPSENDLKLRWIELEESEKTDDLADSIFEILPNSHPKKVAGRFDEYESARDDSRSGAKVDSEYESDLEPEVLEELEEEMTAPVVVSKKQRRRK